MTTAQNNAAISKKIIAIMAMGASLNEAYDAVFGVGQYDKMVEGIYNTLRANGTAAGSRHSGKENKS